MGFEHISVMPEQVNSYQNLGPGKICVDCTLGGAGHAADTIRAIQPDGLFIGLDQDKDAIGHATAALEPYQQNTRLFHSNYSDLAQILAQAGINAADAILLDLGFSLNQLTRSGRGFSFNKNEPLDMRMDTRNHLTAEQILKDYSEKQLADLFFKFGEERHARRIARRIVKVRAEAPLTSSLELASLVSGAVPTRHGPGRRIHPATRVFQALRIAVNRELERLDTFMAQAPDLLKEGGRLCVISFHSLEDRIVKHWIRKHEDGCTCPKELPVCLCGFVPKLKAVSRKPILPTPQEIKENPMARSAKLRVAQRI